MGSRTYQAIIFVLLCAVGTLLYLYLTKPCPSIDNYFTPQEKERLRLSIKYFDYMTYVITKLNYGSRRQDNDGETLSSWIASKENTGVGLNLNIKQWDRIFIHLIEGSQGSVDEIERLDKKFLYKEEIPWRGLNYLNNSYDLRRWDKLNRLWGGNKDEPQQERVLKVIPLQKN